MSLSKNMARELTYQIQKNKLTITEFAEKLRIARSSLQTYLSGTGNASIDTVEYLASQLEITPNELLGINLDDLSMEQREKYNRLIQKVQADLWELEKMIRLLPGAMLQLPLPEDSTGNGIEKTRRHSCTIEHTCPSVYEKSAEETGPGPVPMLGDPAPAFTAATTRGVMHFPEDYKGRWIILFSYPSDFEPISTRELLNCSSMAEEFQRLHTDLAGLSANSRYVHLAWLQQLQEQYGEEQTRGLLHIPLIEDIRMEIGKKFRMFHPAQSGTALVRAVLIIDPRGVIRTMLYYPLSAARDFEEMKRLILALQAADGDRENAPGCRLEETGDRLNS